MYEQESDMLSFIDAQELPVMLLDLLDVAEVSHIRLDSISDKLLYATNLLKHCEI